MMVVNKPQSKVTFGENWFSIEKKSAQLLYQIRESLLFKEQNGVVSPGAV